MNRTKLWRLAAAILCAVALGVYIADGMAVWSAIATVGVLSNVALLIHEDLRR